MISHFTIVNVTWISDNEAICKTGNLLFRHAVCHTSCISICADSINYFVGLVKSIICIKKIDSLFIDVDSGSI